MDKRGWHRESDPNKTYYDYSWDGCELSLNVYKKIEHLTREEAISLAEWILESVPKIGYKITTLFDEKPRYIYTEDDDLVDFEVEEVQK